MRTHRKNVAHVFGHVLYFALVCVCQKNAITAPFQLLTKCGCDVFVFIFIHDAKRAFFKHGAQSRQNLRYQIFARKYVRAANDALFDYRIIHTRLHANSNMCAREYSDFLCLFFAYLVELFFKIGFALGCKRSVLHVDLSVCAKTVVVERTLACGTLHQTFEVLVEHVLARFDVGKVLRKRSALALDTAKAFCVFADRNDACKAHAFDVMLAI